MIRIYEDWPKLARQGYEVRVDAVPEGFRKACVLGMGGSASGGDIIAGWLSDNQGVEFSVYKGQLPSNDMDGTLALACSASGGTVETIEMMKMAMRKNATVVSISRGGPLAKVSTEMGVPHIEMPEIVAPRYMLPFIVFSCLAVFEKALNLGRADEVKEAIMGMEQERAEIGLSVPESSNVSKKVASIMSGKVPVIYGSRATRGAGVRFKNVLNENAKVHAHFDLVPDAFHNEIEAWENPSDEFLPIFLRHPTEAKNDTARMDLMEKILVEMGKEPLRLEGRGKSSFPRLATMVYVLDMASYYLAVRNGTDPLPTKLIDRMKSGT